jgi:hypothetical protein
LRSPMRVGRQELSKSTSRRLLMRALYSYSVFRKWSPSEEPFPFLEVFRIAEKNATVKGLRIGVLGGNGKRDVCRGRKETLSTPEATQSAFIKSRRYSLSIATKLSRITTKPRQKSVKASFWAWEQNSPSQLPRCSLRNASSRRIVSLTLT